uniref:Sodium-driven chloride bicarbonate exchanger-like n=1 Tax=Cicer arietinum TaxID=3827 RepID=A0A3Q7XFR3_CICAR|nr:sodium-driven chloride bicarbonate exchanger-like [Cicer arietinum]
MPHFINDSLTFAVDPLHLSQPLTASPSLSPSRRRVIISLASHSLSRPYPHSCLLASLLSDHLSETLQSNGLHFGGGGVDFQKLVPKITKYRVVLSFRVGKADGSLSIVETLASTAFCGIIHSIFGGQPLLLLGVAEQTIIMFTYLYNFCKNTPQLVYHQNFDFSY